MANEQYDVSKKMQRLFEEKQKIRQAIRQAVLKQESNPYMPPGSLFDPAIVKYHAMLHYKAEHVRPNPKNVAGFVGFVVIPIIGMFIHLTYNNRKREKLFRSGKLSYQERYHQAYV